MAASEAQDERRAEGLPQLWPFVAGILAGAAGAVLAQALFDKRGLDLRLVKGSREDPQIPPVVVVPGILGSELLRPDGTQVWLNFGNAFGYHKLSLPYRLPLQASQDDLVPGPLLGAETVVPRLFGFTEYADLLALFREAGFRPLSERRQGAAYHVFSYDWRRDLVESARRLHETLEALADATGNPHARFNVVGHSMGGLVARYYLRFGTDEPAEAAPVTWAGARRIATLILGATPNGGAIHALDTILNGTRVGLSTTTLSAEVVAGMPALYQLLPPRGVPALLDHRGGVLAADLLDVATWERFGWGPFGPGDTRWAETESEAQREAHREFMAAALGRARAFHAALDRTPETPCPARVIALGGDCVPTLARAVVPEERGAPRFEPRTPAESDAMYEAGDGRVTRASVLASHLPGADDGEWGSGVPELTQAFIGAADHHGLYAEPTFQSLLVRALIRPARPRRVQPGGPSPAAVAVPAARG
jgi:pimeloyl-ACP methyl ester carboxylesterase